MIRGRQPRQNMIRSQSQLFVKYFLMSKIFAHGKYLQVKASDVNGLGPAASETCVAPASGVLSELVTVDVSGKHFDKVNVRVSILETLIDYLPS